MKKFIKLVSALVIISTFTGCTTSNDCQYKKHNNYQETCQKCGEKNCKHKTHTQSKKLHTKIYSRNKQGGISEIGYIKLYDSAQGVKMFVNIDNLRTGVDYIAKISQCKDAKCTNPDKCCMDTIMTMEMPLTRKDKANSTLQETFIINDVTTDKLQGATIFLERDNGYRAAWGFFD